MRFFVGIFIIAATLISFISAGLGDGMNGTISDGKKNHILEVVEAELNGENPLMVLEEIRKVLGLGKDDDIKAELVRLRKEADLIYPYCMDSNYQLNEEDFKKRGR